MRKDTTKYEGVLPALYTCYEDNGEFSPSRTRALARMLIDKGVKGLYVGGSSGECIYLSPRERMALLEAVMEEARGRCTVIAHVACNNTRDGVSLAAHAQGQGVDAIAAIPPIYFHLPERAIARYWNDLSAAAPETDFIIYNIPQLAGVALTLPLLREMLKNPRVAGVKNSSMSTQDIQQFKAEGGEGFVVFNGPDEQFVAGRAIGADGGIGGTYAAMPELFLRMDALLRAGRLADARKLQYRVNEIIYALCAGQGSMYAMIKAVIGLREGIELGSVRAPLLPLGEGDGARVEVCARLIDAAIAEV